MKNFYATVRTAFLLLVILTGNSVVLSSFKVPDPAPFLKKTEKERVFSIIAITNDLNEFRELVKQASRLKPYGKVRFQISDLADKNFYAIPKIVGNAWYEYAGYMSSISKFFPDQKLAPFIPAGFVKKNRELILGKAKILKENGMEAVFYAHEPEYLPDAFFDAYPNMRGPRVDHPRRSAHAAFATCMNVREVREMYMGMMAALIKNVPEIKVFHFAVNDAGSGLCWSDESYSGPNGPGKCKGLSTAERVATIMNTFKEGALKGGHEVEMYLTAGASMFSDREKEDIKNNLPANCYFEGYKSPEIVGLNSFLYESFPVTGIINPLPIINNLKSLGDPGVKTLFIDLGASYSNGNERLDVSDKMISMIENQLRDPAANGPEASLQQLHALCESWAGKHSSGQLFNAFFALDEAMKYKQAMLPGLSTLYWGVTARYINRPLVVAPQLLTEKEEAYFLPHVFNISKEEARMDYADIHGLHWTIPAGAVSGFVNKIQAVSIMLDSVDQHAPLKEFIQKMATSLRMYASIVRSCGNFMEAQAIRDRNAIKLKNPRRPDKVPTLTGDPEFLRFNEVMRDELDNAQEMIELLEDNGMGQIIHARDTLHEDIFLPGPDLIEQIKEKRKIMLNHWLDAQSFFTPPFI